MSKDMDRKYHPRIYFRPDKLERLLKSKVKSAALRKKLKGLFEQGQHAELRQAIDAAALSDEVRKALGSLAAECRLMAQASELEIQTRDTPKLSLESLRPLDPPDWQLVASGGWSQDIYHSGRVAYYIANIGPGQWLLDRVERNDLLDGVTEEDVEEGRLNDDQYQAMWGMTLEEAQECEYRQICAACLSAGDQFSAQEMAFMLYCAMCQSEGIGINEPDDSDGLLVL